MPVYPDARPDMRGFFDSLPAHPVPIVFFDVDGVLHSADAEPDSYLGMVHLERLRRIVVETRARLVLSSTWRLTSGCVQELHVALQRAGLPPPVGATADLWPQGRAHEISEWVASHGFEQWVAIDDLPLPDLLEEHVVTTDGAVGLSDCDADETIRKLRAQSVERAT